MMWNISYSFLLFSENFDNLRSSRSGLPVRLKFLNRSHKYSTIFGADPEGKFKKLKDIPPRKAWVFDACEGHYFIAKQKGSQSEVLALNYGWFYLAKKHPDPQYVQKILITEGNKHLY